MYFAIKTLNAFLVSPIRATYATYLNLIESISLKVLLGQKLRSILSFLLSLVQTFPPDVLDHRTGC